MADDNRWVTIVVRAWVDVEGVRARLLLADSDGGRDHRVVASIDDAMATVDTWLQMLDDRINHVIEATEQHHTAGRDAGAAEQDQAATTERRRTVRRDTDAADDGRAEDE